MAIGRMAGQVGKWLFTNPETKKMMTPMGIAGRLGPDVFFGGLAAAQTPGDIGDKLLAGGGQAVFGGLGGLAAGKAVGSIIPNPGASMLADYAGSIGGDYAGMYLADQGMRAKDKLMGGSGQTAWEKMGTQQQEQMRQELQNQILSQYGLLPGTREQYARDDFMIDNGLG